MSAQWLDSLTSNSAAGEVATTTDTLNGSAARLQNQAPPPAPMPPVSGVPAGAGAMATPVPPAQPYPAQPYPTPTYPTPAYPAQPTIVIFGGVHTGVALANLAKQIGGFRVVVVDARGAWATPERFPTAVHAPVRATTYR